MEDRIGRRNIRVKKQKNMKKQLIAVSTLNCYPRRLADAGEGQYTAGLRFE
jgi:hypothetical protein